MAKIGPCRKRNVALAGGAVFLEHLGAGDVRRHQVRGELHAVEREVHAVRERADHQRLRQPRHADQKRVPLTQQGDQQEFQHFLLADDDLAAFGEDAVAGVAELLRGHPLIHRQTNRLPTHIH